jgi:hypothetical protein
LLKSPSGIRRDSIFNHFVDSLAVTVKFTQSCNYNRDYTHLYFDSTGYLIARSVQHTSGQAVHSTYNYNLIHNAENLSPSLFFTADDGKHYYYDSSKHNLQILPYDELDCWYSSEEVIPAGIGLSPNVKYALLKKSTSEPICDFVYEDIEKLSDEFAIVTKNQLRGILNTEGKEIIPCAYETFYPQLNSGLIVVERDDKYGLFNTKGKELISCNYDRIAYFEDGSAIVEKDNKFGVLNTKKQKNISCEYEYDYGPLNNKLSIIAREGHFYDGFEIIEKNYFFEGGCEIVAKNDKYGIIDTKGKEIISCEYDRIDGFFNDGFAITEKEKRDSYYIEYTMINTKGKAISRKYHEINYYEEGGIAIVEKDEKYGMVDMKGKEIIPRKYDWVLYYEEYGIAIIGRVDEDGEPLQEEIINTKGKIISRKYHEIGRFTDGFAIAEKDGKELMLNTKGKEISYKYDHIHYHKNDKIITAKKDNKQVLLNNKGKEVSYKYDYISLFSDGFSKVGKNQNIGLINTKGKELIPCKYKAIDLCYHWKNFDSVYQVRVSQEGDKNMEIIKLVND